MSYIIGVKLLDTTKIDNLYIIYLAAIPSYFIYHFFQPKKLKLDQKVATVLLFLSVHFYMFLIWLLYKFLPKDILFIINIVLYFLPLAYAIKFMDIVYKITIKIDPNFDKK